jgi:serine protease Do
MTNNPGAAGGAITDLEGRLIGLIGKELKDQNTGAWINFAIPIGQLADSVHEIRSGRMVVQSGPKTRIPTEPITTRLLGLVLVPDIFSKTPPYVDRTISGSPAEQQGILPDDLIIEINGNLTPSIKEVVRQLSQIDRDEEMELTVQRDGKFHKLKLGLLR